MKKAARGEGSRLQPFLVADSFHMAQTLRIHSSVNVYDFSNTIRGISAKVQIVFEFSNTIARISAKVQILFEFSNTIAGISAKVQIVFEFSNTIGGISAKVQIVFESSNTFHGVTPFLRTSKSFLLGILLEALLTSEEAFLDVAGLTAVFLPSKYMDKAPPAIEQIAATSRAVCIPLRNGEKVFSATSQLCGEPEATSDPDKATATDRAHLAERLATPEATPAFCGGIDVMSEIVADVPTSETPTPSKESAHQYVA